MAAGADDHRYCPACDAVFRTSPRCCPRDGTKLEIRADDPLIGRILLDSIELQERIGRGRTAVVYRALDHGAKTMCAVKLLWGETASDHTSCERFAREAASSSVLDHPNIVRVVGFGTHRGWLPFTVTDLIEGRSLSDLLAREAPLDARRAAMLVRDLCWALAYLHQRGLVHRDIRPGNVLVVRGEDRERAKLFDFGLALSKEERSGEQRRLTPHDTSLGSMRYIAPEQLVNGRVDHRADLFPLGIILYEMLAGRPPFDGKAELVAMRNATKSAPPVAERVPGLEVDPKLEAIARKLMALRREDRYASAVDAHRHISGHVIYHTR